ncbi:MAG: hypothetical protein AMJ56_12125 [Anaerolineae bacterium SG8_19]|jgi:hypothetical protein|nr:MAG: hypothetical protein AMJ56_12125 [Anaerolineae bacterium SG8_19]
MECEQQYHSYLIRLWQDELKDEGPTIPRWQGEVFHIQSGQSWPVSDLKILSDLLKELTTKSKP